VPDSSAGRDPFDRLAEEFVARLRRGERPSLDDYAARHPELAEQVRELFPALIEMEQLKDATVVRDPEVGPALVGEDPTRVGEFRVLRRIGKGGMGVVYEAVQESLGRHVALKLLPAEAVAEPRPRTELVWDGKYDANGKRVAPLKVALPFQAVETVNHPTTRR
jgi:eukaryotic-like serine/threonine-protein kinase